MDIQCPNPECRADNPTGAKFCRKCGTAIKGSNATFTLDVFKSIAFQPVSVVKIRFVNRFVLILSIMFTGLGLSIATGLTERLFSYFYWTYRESDHYNAAIACLALSALYAFFVIKSLFKKCRYALNADYIEESFIDNGIVRIARKSKMGLFDKKKKKVLLSSDYSNIEKFDSNHLLISKETKKGLYSLTYRKVIIPPMYDSISQFANSVTSATVQGTEHHYDVKGNELR